MKVLKGIFLVLLILTVLVFGILVWQQLGGERNPLTALFPTDGGYLALGWRRLTSSETELMEDFLAGTGSETGVWNLDSDPYSTLESYVHLGAHWYCLSAFCDGMEDKALLRLVDGTVEASAEEETARPRASSAQP